MDNEELKPEVETEGQEPELDNFDALWNDDDEFVPSNEPDAQPESKEDEAEEKTEEEPENADDAQPEQKPEAENQRFKLKVNGEEIEVDRDEVIALAQKGKDYDRVKTERDNLKTDSATMNKLKAQGDFLEELAKSSGMTVDQLMENTRARMLMNEHEGMTEEEALKQVREKASKATEKKESEKAEATPEERRQAMFANFLQAYPDVKAEDIPQEVWNDAGRTYDLVGAYQRHENRELRKEIETLRQNNKNKERSTGSTKSAGTRNANQAFDALWYDDDD
jgi:hypothetical protein